MALERMLVRWRILPHSARLELYRLYLADWQDCSEFAIWLNLFPLLSLEDRYRFYLEASLVFPEFAGSMQAVWYQSTLQGDLDSLD